ncbi:MAG: phosphate--AMP phosphotransferase [Oscillospiraceae bacterium]|nr:phosphate--AMP phosphotransferase [Oscillospiraceae bacterium]
MSKDDRKIKEKESPDLTADSGAQEETAGTVLEAAAAETKAEKPEKKKKSDKDRKAGKNKKSDRSGKSEDEALKAEIKALRERLIAQQQLVRDQKLPVIVLVEGWAAAGKGSLINELICEIDPRFYNVFSPVLKPESEERYPFLYEYAKAIPENGKIMFYDSGWMEAAVRKYLRREITKKTYKDRIRAVNEFERQLRDGGYLVLKIFLDIGRKEQEKRLSALKENFETEWRVTEDDLWQHREYKLFRETCEDFMEKTGKLLPWHVLNGEKKREATRDALKLMADLIDEGLEKGRYVGKPFKESFPLLKMPKLSEVDLSPSLTDEEYRKELKKLQKRLGELHNTVYRKRIPVILCYEGWDAAGKGGNIRRIARPLDPRGFDVMPIASPEPHELNRQYLWRFWTRLPRSGHFCIFDRTWYGRVMVERLEGFCTEDDWKRAYNEINEFERQLTDWGAVVLKFWIHIDQDTQLQRFNDRQNTPEKQWKLTDEDWRNREKWPQYEEAIDEMIEKTSTENAPWFVIESNDKKYARIKTLRLTIAALEKAVSRPLAEG